MNVHWCRNFGGGALAGVVWFGLTLLPLRGQEALSAQEIIQRAVARSQSNQPAKLSAYSYTKITVSEQLDAAGNVKERKQKVYLVSTRNGVTSARLVAVNGQPPDEAELKKQAENDQTARQWLGQGKSNQGDNRDRLLTPELAARYEYTALDPCVLNGRPAYRIHFQPKDPPLPVRRIADRLLNRVSGTLWIDATEFELARAEFFLGSEVDFLGGLVGTLKKLAYTITRTRVADGLWLNTCSSGTYEGRKLLDPLRVKTNSQLKDFKILARLAYPQP